MIAFVNGRVLLDEGFATDVAVLVDAERIVDVVPASAARTSALDTHDLGGRCLVPGFIDCQVNGGGGILFNDDPSLETLRRIGAAHARFGTTGFLPTLISDTREAMRAALDAVAAARAVRVPGVLGVHLEGPFIAPDRRGIHDAAHFRPIADEDVERICAAGLGKVLVTLAPERVGAARIRALAGRSVIVALGHSAADYATAKAALAAGASGFTHLFNAMTPLQSREPGVVGAALEDRESWCGIIVDGHHVHPATLRVALAAKAPGKLFLVTDAMPPVGAGTSDFVLNGESIARVDGRCTDARGTLAGSCLDMASAVRNSIAQLGLPLAEAARMASTYPAAFLGLERHGRIAPGYVADFVVLDTMLDVRETWIGGARVFAG